MSWGAACLAFLAAATERLALVPSFHFVFYLKALESLLVGVGVVALCRPVSRFVHTYASRIGPVAIEGTLVFLVAVGLFACKYPSYARRTDFVLDRAKAIVVSARNDRIAAIDWIETHTDPKAIFLSPAPLALFVVGPSGRKVVAVEPYFSNPYVNWLERDRASRGLFELLRRHDEAGFRGLAQRFDVGHVVAEDPDTEWLRRVPILQETFRCGLVRIYAVRPAFGGDPTIGASSAENLLRPARSRAPALPHVSSH